MAKRVQTTSQHNHNKSLLYSNKPKFKEDIRANIYKDEIPVDGILFAEIPENNLSKVIEKIRYNARLDTIRDLKILAASIIITILLIILFVNKVEKEIEDRQSQSEINFDIS